MFIPIVFLLLRTVGGEGELEKYHDLTRPQGYKTFFVLNSSEHEILHAHKYKNIKEFGFFLGSDKPRMLFSRS